MIKAILISFFIFTLGACAQNRKIINSKAYFKQSMAGARLIVIDTDGKETERPPDTLHIIYLLLKTSDGTPEIDTIVYRNRAYQASIQSLPDNETEVGKTRIGSQAIYLKPSKGTTWWLLQLIPLQKAGSSVNSRSIILKGQIRHKPFALKIEHETELEADIRM